MAAHHITDRELLLEADGEVSSARATAIREHLAECWSCRTRKAELEQAIADFVHVHQAQDVPPIDGARARLATRLAAEPQASTSAWWRAQPQAALGAAAAVLLLAAGLSVLRFSEHRDEPNSAWTPGAAHSLSRDEVCSAPTEARPIAASTAQAVFQRYGIRDPRPRAYEVDYLIPPSLGGSQELSNLWPQPYASGVWNSRVKDALEDRLHSLVCDGKLDLATAQHDLSHDWFAAYKKYFQTDQPRFEHLAFVKDRPWE